MKNFLSHLAGWWHVYGSVITTIGVAALPALQQQVSAHPAWSSALATVAVICAKLSKSPLQVT